ncbi:hypothetical protein [Corynebacterium kalidii]|uniref:Uncharacterized protein n=1 Tax=Corynebacterium kalidii TaxID=2931982 RepID=A0A9X1WHG0_9CORY|nr:hypothetical protein [Corynebacterium kalidii]MCJ7858543.1 hypothetical protein [Corynebacterium kalidii]
MARSKERYQRLVRGYGLIYRPSMDPVLFVALAPVGFVVNVISSGGWGFLPLLPVFIVIIRDANRSQNDIMALNLHLRGPGALDDLNIEDLQWLHTRARRRFVGVFALSLAAMLMMILPLVPVAVGW